MHYKNGREAKIGDRVVGRDWSGNPMAGIVVQTVPGATSCNVGIVPIPTSINTCNSSELIHLDDAMEAPVKPDPAPEPIDPENPAEQAVS